MTYGARARRERERQHVLASGVAACLLMGKTLAETGAALGVSLSLAHRVTQRLERHFGTDKRHQLVEALANAAREAA